jgi:molybdenum cofactor cytidylyltransferase
MQRIVGILLAAGSSRRFGSNKLLMPLADGTLLAGAAAGTLIATVPESIAVVRPGDAELATLLAGKGLRIVECAEAELGMGHSLAAGVAAASGADAWLIALADMPSIRISTFTRISAQLRAGSALVAPFHAGRRGHPVGFSARFDTELLSLTGDAGARDLFAGHALSLTRLDVDDPGILIDVDTPGDLAAQCAGQSVAGLTS